MTPKQKPGRSKQDYGTPPEFLAAVKARLGIADFVIDLAASEENAVCRPCESEIAHQPQCPLYAEYALGVRRWAAEVVDDETYDLYRLKGML